MARLSSMVDALELALLMLALLALKMLLRYCTMVHLMAIWDTVLVLIPVEKLKVSLWKIERG